MSDIKIISQDIYDKEKTKTHRDLVYNFEKHKDFLDTIDYKDDPEIYDLYSRLVADYGIALAKIEAYKKALPILNQGLELFKKNKHYSWDELKKLPFYENLLFNRGISNYYLDNYQNAKQDFQLLLKIYPDNTIYEKWLIAINNVFLNRLKNVLWISGSIVLAFEVFLDQSRTLKNILLTGVSLFLISALVLELITYRRKKKYVA